MPIQDLSPEKKTIGIPITNQHTLKGATKPSSQEAPHALIITHIKIVEIV